MNTRKCTVGNLPCMMVALFEVIAGFIPVLALQHADTSLILCSTVGATHQLIIPSLGFDIETTYKLLLLIYNMYISTYMTIMVSLN